MSEKRKMYMLIVSGRMRQLETAIVQVNTACALSEYGAICGIASTMFSLGLIGRNEADAIKAAARTVLHSQEVAS